MHTPLTYELDTVERILHALLDKEPFDFALENDTVPLLIAEIEKVKKNFIHEVFNFDDEVHLQRYIQFHQQELIRIIDSLHRKDSSIDAIHLIEDLLDFIERHFTSYFNQNVKAPERYIAITGAAILDVTNEYQEALAVHKVEPNLISLVLAPLRKFSEHTSSGRVTYREIMYAKELSKEIKKMLRIGSFRLDDSIRNLLLYMNYNAIGYFNYYTRYLQEQVKTLESRPEKIEKLSYFLKTINQTQVKPGVAYHPVYPSLKEQVVDWISEEISYEEKVFQLTQKKLVAAGPLPADFKVQIDMSLSQLAYILRVFIEAKIVQTKNLSEVLRFFAKYYQVKNQKIAYESLRVRYYNPEESIRKSVRSILLQLVDLINKV
jgi:hypothetical protein